MQAIQIKRNQNSIAEEVARQVQLALTSFRESEREATIKLQEQIQTLEKRVEELENQLSNQSTNKTVKTKTKVKVEKVKEPTINELKNKARGMGVTESEARKIGRLTLKSTWIKAIQEREEFDKMEAAKATNKPQQETNKIVKLVKPVKAPTPAKVVVEVEPVEEIQTLTCLNPFNDDLINSLLKEFELDRQCSINSNELPF